MCIFLDRVWLYGPGYPGTCVDWYQTFCLCLPTAGIIGMRHHSAHLTFLSGPVFLSFLAFMIFGFLVCFRVISIITIFYVFYFINFIINIYFIYLWFFKTGFRCASLAGHGTQFIYRRGWAQIHRNLLISAS